MKNKTEWFSYKTIFKAAKTHSYSIYLAASIILKNVDLPRKKEKQFVFSLVFA